MAKPEWMPQRLYQWTKPRSLMLHALFLVIAGGCLIAMWWQVNRAMQGNTLSYLYSVEWPAIAVVVGIGWWQLVHDTPEDIAQRKEFHERMRQASAEVVARTLPRSALAVTVDSQQVGGRALGPSGPRGVPAATAAGAITSLAGGAAGTGGTPGTGGAAGIGGALVIEPNLLPAGRAPVGLATSGEADVRLLEPDDAGEPADELTEYNRYLAGLAVRGRAKTWRNPRGL